MVLGYYDNSGREIECIDGNGKGGTEILDVFSEIGKTYFIQVYDADQGWGDFDICLTTKSPNPSSDCTGAEVICKNDLIEFAPTGRGTDDFEDENNHSGCLKDGENQSVWYYFEILTSAPRNRRLSFRITPESSLDYDFAIFGPNVQCDSLGYPIRCSWADANCSLCPDTGLNLEYMDGEEGAEGDGFVAPINVQPGEGYYLLVDNYGQDATAFRLDWTTTISDFLNCQAVVPCGIIADAGTSVVFCEEEEIQLQGSATGVSANAEYIWTAEAGAVELLNATETKNPTLSVPTNFMNPLDYTLTIKENGCEDKDVVRINRECFATDEERCQNEMSVFLDVLSPDCMMTDNGRIKISHIRGGRPPYLYKINQGIFDSQRNFTGLSEGSHLIAVKDNLGCIVEVEEIIPPPNIPNIDLGPDITINLGNSVQLTAASDVISKNVKKVVWSGTPQTNCTSPCLSLNFIPDKSGTISAELETTQGCTSSDEILITVVSEFHAYIPNSFSPNGDGLNDVFTISATGVDRISSLQIFNRWGGVIYSNTNFPPNDDSFGWDGRINSGRSGSNVFVVFVEFLLTDGKSSFMTGDVIVFRE